jgi:hypothetical protein
MLQVARLRFPFPMRSLDFSFDPVLPASLCSWGQISLYQKLVLGIFLGVKGGRRLRLTTSPPSVIRLYRKCRFFDVSQTYEARRSIYFTFTFTSLHCKHIFLETIHTWKRDKMLCCYQGYQEKSVLPNNCSRLLLYFIPRSLHVSAFTGHHYAEHKSI